MERLFPVERTWEMTRNLGAHPAWLWNPIISKFWYSSYIVITLHNLKILASLLFFSHPTISNFYQPINWIFFGLVISLNYNYYYSISNITVSLQQSVICFGYFMPTSHGVIPLMYIIFSFLQTSLLNLQTVQAPPTPPPFLGKFTLSPIYWFFMSPKIGFSRERPH